MMDFAVLPPEVNSGRMYAGAGAGPLMAASVAWDGLAAELGSAAASYRAVVAELTSQPWLGPAAASMAAAAAPYVAWMDGTGVQAEQAAVQARAAVAAYEAAFAATVPPPMIEANRALVMSLVATNLLGQNSAAIAAAEAQYAQMWAQDVAAMVGYAAGAEAASVSLTPFSVQAPTTSATGIAAQAAAVDQAVVSGGMQSAQTTAAAVTEAVSVNPLQPLLNFLASPLNQLLSGTFGAAATLGGWSSGAVFIAAGTNSVTAAEQAAAAAKAGADSVPSLQPQTPVEEATEDAEAEVEGAILGAEASGVVAIRPAGTDAAAMLGRAGSLAGLSVPQSLTTSSPAVRLAAVALPMDAARAGMAPGMLSGLPLMGSVVNAPRNGEARSKSGARLRVLPSGQAVAAGDTAATTPHTSGQPVKQPLTAPPEDALSDKEREELDRLRAVRAELEMERDAATRLIKEAIRR